MSEAERMAFDRGLEAGRAGQRTIRKERDTRHPAKSEDVQALVEALGAAQDHICSGAGEIGHDALMHKINAALRPFKAAEPLTSTDAIQENGVDVE